MVRTDDELTAAQAAVSNLEKLLVQARQAHTPAQYDLLSKPLLLELQQRQREIVEYLIGGGEVGRAR